MDIIPNMCRTAINMIIVALPTIGALLLLRSEAQKRKLNKQEISAIYFIFWGFVLFAFRENATLTMSNWTWYLGWIFPLFVGFIFTGISIYLICKYYYKL